MSSTRAALRRNEAKSMQSSSSSSSSANVRSGSIPSIRGAGSFQNAGAGAGPRPGPGANQVALRAATNQMTQGNPNAMRMQQQQQQQQHRQYTQSPSQNIKNEPKKKLTIEQAITLITLRLGRLEVSMQDIEGNENGTGSGGGMNADLAQNILGRLDALEEESTGTSMSASAGGDLSGSVEYATKSEVSLLSQQLDALKNVVSKSASKKSASASSPATETALNNLRSEVKELRDTLKTIETMVFSHDSQIMLLNMNAEANAIDDDAVLDDEDADAVLDDADAEENVHIPDTSPTVIVEDEPESENDDIDE